MMIFPKCKAIIFDFDGVICESVAVKTEAFRRLFLSYPEQLDQILAFHIDNGGLSRYKKFDYIYKNILKQPLTDTVSQELGKRFSEYCYEAVVAAPLVAGAEEFLNSFYQKIPFFIVSGTPQDEMRQIIKDKKLEEFFKAVYGSPRTKEELNRIILKENHLQPADVYFIGDSINDYDGAVRAGIPFIGRSEEPHNAFRDLNVPVIRNLQNLKEMINA